MDAPPMHQEPITRAERFVVAGVPRSGTTMMFRALAGLPPGATKPADYDGPIIKTHSFKPKRYLDVVRGGIFLFGDVTCSVLSTMANRNDSRHFKNCGAEDLDPELVDLTSSDHLNYERMFDAWTRPTGFPHACVRYERLHEVRPALEALLGMPIPLPERRPRSTGREQADPDVVARIEQSYRSLIAKVAAAPDLAWYH